MELDIHVDENKVNEALDKAEQTICDEWFDGDRDAYEEWAGDRVSDGFWNLIQTLGDICGIAIDPCSKNILKNA